VGLGLPRITSQNRPKNQSFGRIKNMKLLGVTNGKKILTSVAHYDYRVYGEGQDYIMMDGGQSLNGDFCYNRFSVTGEKLWFEVPQTFAELYNDYNLRNREYGIWNLKDVKLLLPEEIPDISSFQWQAENAIWGTNGKDGKSSTTYVLIKDCEESHLQKISQLLEARKKLPFAPVEKIESTKKIVDFWLDKKANIATV